MSSSNAAAAHSLVHLENVYELQQSSSSIIGNQLALPDVARQHGVGCVASLRFDPPGWDSSLGSAGSESGAEGVPRIGRGGVEASGRYSLPDYA